MIIFISSSAFFLFLGLAVNVALTTENSEFIFSLLNFWLLSWPYLISLVFLPILLLILKCVNQRVLNRYASFVSKVLTDQNVNKYESRNLFWKVGSQCEFISIALMTKLDNNSEDFEEVEKGI